MIEASPVSSIETTQQQAQDYADAIDRLFNGPNADDPSVIDQVSSLRVEATDSLSSLELSDLAKFTAQAAVYSASPTLGGLFEDAAIKKIEGMSVNDGIKGLHKDRFDHNVSEQHKKFAAKLEADARRSGVHDKPQAHREAPRILVRQSVSAEVGSSTPVVPSPSIKPVASLITSSVVSKPEAAPAPKVKPVKAVVASSVINKAEVKAVEPVASQKVEDKVVPDIEAKRRRFLKLPKNPLLSLYVSARYSKTAEKISGSEKKTRVAVLAGAVALGAAALGVDILTTTHGHAHEAINVLSQHKGAGHNGTNLADLNTSPKNLNNVHETKAASSLNSNSFTAETKANSNHVNPIHHIKKHTHNSASSLRDTVKTHKTTAHKHVAAAKAKLEAVLTSGSNPYYVAKEALHFKINSILTHKQAQIVLNYDKAMLKANHILYAKATDLHVGTKLKLLKNAASYLKQLG